MILKTLLTFFWVMLMLTLTACDKDNLSPQAQIKETIEKMELAAEARSLSSFMENVSKQYSDHEGNDYKAIARYVQLNYLRNQSINIFSHIQSIEVNGNTATAEVSVAMGGRGQDLSDEQGRLKADTMHFSILFTKQGQEWHVKSVSWRRGW